MRKFSSLLVTGGAGFIGSNFVNQLVQAMPDCEVTVLDKLTYAGGRDNLASNAKFVEGDICDEALLDKIFPQIEGIVNFAAETHVDRSLQNAHNFILTDVLGVEILSKMTLKHALKIFLHVSTDEVYGDIPEGSSIESDKINPRNPYSASKAGGEMMARSYYSSFEMPLVITRGSNTYGPSQFPEKVIPLFICNALEGKPFPIYGEGRAHRDFMYVYDHCAGIISALQEGKIGEIYNLGAGGLYNTNEIAHTILDHLGLQGKEEEYIEYVQDRPGHDYRYSLDSSKAKREFNWQALTSFQVGLQSTIDWYVNNPTWWQKRRSKDYWDFYAKNYHQKGTP